MHPLPFGSPWSLLQLLEKSGESLLQLVRNVWHLFYVVSITGILCISFRNWAYDDPFITYRYAQNLAQGVGFVFNPGEKVLSTTTPLFALLLAAFSRPWINVPLVAVLIGALGLALGGVFIWDLARSWKTPIVGLAGLLLYPTFPLLITTLGSEIPLYLAFCLGAFAFYARQKYNSTAIFAALATLTRPDGLLVVVILITFHLVRKCETIPYKAILIFMGLTLPWFIFAWIYFGTPLPVTLAAKQHQGAMVISQRFAPRFLKVVRNYASHWHYRFEAVLAFWGIVHTAWHPSLWLLFLSWPVLYFTVYTLLGVSGYYWYYAALVPGIIAAVGLGITALNALWLVLMRRWFHNRKVQINQVAPLLVTTLVFLLGFGQVRDLYEIRKSSDPRILLYRAIGEWLRANTPLNAKVGALEVGTIGYHAQRSMIDFAGLLQPEVADQLTEETTYGDAARWATMNYRPDYLVLSDGAYPELENTYIIQHCQVAQRFPGKNYGYQGTLIVYACGKD